MKKIVDYTFDLQGLPIDRSGQDNHGISHHTVAQTDAADRHAVAFLAPTSRIHIPYTASFAQIGAVRITAHIRFDTLDQRANVVEIDQSALLFVRPDGIVTFVVYSPKKAEDPDPDGDINSFTIDAPPIQPTDPFDTLTSNPLPPFEWVGLNTTATFNPDAVARTVQAGTFVNIMAEHDGLGTMRIWIDGTLAAIRQDMDYKVLPLARSGQVTIGARPQDGAYTLRGVIDRLRIWRNDPQEPYETFFCRPVSTEAKDCWRGVYRGIATGMSDSNTGEATKELVRIMDAFGKALAQALARLRREDRQRLFRLSATYKRLWCQNALDSPAFEQVIADMIDLIEAALPGALYQLTGQIFAAFADGKMAKVLQGGACVAKHDPAWPHYMQAIARRFPPPPGTDPKHPYDPQKPDPSKGRKNKTNAYQKGTEDHAGT